MVRKRGALVLLISLMLAVGLMACGNGGGGGGGEDVPAVPTLQSINSVHHEDLATDGDWFIWTGMREGILLYDGSGVRDLTRDMEGLEAKELAFDGRYLAVRATDTTKAYGDTTDVGHVGIYFYDTEDSSPPLQTIDLTAEEIRRFYDMAAGDGVVVYVAEPYVGIYELYAFDMATGTGPVKISGDHYISTNSHATVSGGVVVFEDTDTDEIIAADVSDLAAFSAATDLSMIGDPGFDPKIDGDVVVWEYSGDIYAYDLGSEFGPVNLTVAFPNSSNDPDLSSGMVAFESYDGGDDEIFIADVNDLANFDTAMGGDDITQLTDNDYDDGYVQIAGDYVAWVCDDDDDEICVGDLGAEDFEASILQVSEGFYNSFEYHDYNEKLYDQYFVLDGDGNVTWTEFDEEGDTSEWYEIAFQYNIADGTYNDTSDLGYYVRIRQTEAVDGQVVAIVRDAFQHLFVKKAGGGEPRVVTPDWMRVHQPDIDDGVAVWSGKPGMACGSGVFWEIYYQDLNKSLSPDSNFQVTFNGLRDKKPAVDGDNGIILWKDYDNYDYYYYFIGDPQFTGVHLLYSGGGSYNLDVDDGLVALRDSNDIYIWDISEPPGTMEEITGSVNVNRCPLVDNGVVAFKSSDTGYDIYYYNTLDAEPALKKATSADYYVDSSSPQIGLSDGYIVFSGYPGASTAGTDTVYLYSIGDPADSLTAIYQTDNTDYGINCTSIGDGLVAFIAKNDGTSEDDQELYTYRIGVDEEAVRVTEDGVVDNKPRVANDYVLWRHGGSSAGSHWVYAIQP